jgi:membrane fusion protein (multidrug efflux system)
MKSKHYIAKILAVSLIGMAVFTYWYDKSRGSATGNFASSNSSKIARSLITTAHPALRTFTLHTPWIGTVEAKTSVELTALVTGRIEQINAEDQCQIEKGKGVMRLGGSQIEEARAKLTAMIESLKSQLDLARQTVERLKESLKTRLATKDQMAAAQEAKVRLETQLRETRLSLKTLENQINITAPTDGIFTNRRVSAGQEVNAGQVVGDIIDTRRLRIAASLFPPRGVVLQGKKATIRLSDNQTLVGIVQRVLPRALSTGAVTVWIEGPQIDTQLRPGQMVGGDIVVKIKPDSLAVPQSAIVYDSQEHPYLFVSKDGAYEPLSIQVSQEQDGWVEVLSGLDQDQLVVTQGAYELFYRKFNEQFKVQD